MHAKEILKVCNNIYALNMCCNLHIFSSKKDHLGIGKFIQQYNQENGVKKKNMDKWGRKKAPEDGKLSY